MLCTVWTTITVKLKVFKIYSYFFHFKVHSLLFQSTTRIHLEQFRRHLAESSTQISEI
jgi:hypothetical protein